MHSSVGESSNLGQTVSVVNMGDGTSISLASQNLSDGVRLRLRLSLSLPLSVEYGAGISISNHRGVDSSVREASDNTTKCGQPTPVRWCRDPPRRRRLQQGTL